MTHTIDKHIHSAPLRHSHKTKQQARVLQSAGPLKFPIKDIPYDSTRIETLSKHVTRGVCDDQIRTARETAISQARETPVKANGRGKVGTRDSNALARFECRYP